MPVRAPHSRRARPRLIKFVIILMLIGLVFNYLRPLPHASASVGTLASEVADVQLNWPAQSQGAFAAQGFGLLATHGSQEQRPTASLAKLITVLAVLEKQPLKPGEQGPTLTMGDADVALFEKYFREGGAYVKVEKGTQLSLYQMLQAVLLPSANNIADGLAVATFGSMDNYHTYANEMLKRLGLNQTIVAGDASGMLPVSKSTPTDLVRLGDLVLQNPVIAEIVAQPSATLPVHGIIYSANSRLGYNNVIGIKTGLTDEAGGCFLFAAKYTVKGAAPVTMIGVITGMPTLNAALAASSPLINSAKPYFVVKTPVKAGDVFGSLTTAWNVHVNVIAKQDITMLTWRGVGLSSSVELARISRSLPKGSQVGTAVVSSGGYKSTAPLVLQDAIAGPDWQWRLRRF